MLAAVLLLTRLNGGGTPSDSATTDQSATSTPTQQPSATRTPTRSASPTPTTPTTSAAPATVTVTKSDYVGRPKADARRDLEALGLNVDERPAKNPGTRRRTPSPT